MIYEYAYEHDSPPASKDVDYDPEYQDNFLLRYLPTKSNLHS